MSDSDIQNAAPGGWRAEDWRTLLRAIQNKECTPFLGAGANAGVLPTGTEMAKALAIYYKYPFSQRYNLARVAQYGAIDVAEKDPKYMAIELIQKNIALNGPPNFEDLDEPHRVIADLPFSTYITTNYDDFMRQALIAVNRPPRLDICKWYEANQQSRSRQDTATGGEFRPSREKPVVFHFHGHIEDPNSIVITEDDYLNFLINISEDEDVIPDYIRPAFQGRAFLFIGYSLEDLNFKVLFRKFADAMRRSGGERHFAVQISPKQFETPKLRARSIKQLEYLQKQLHDQKVKFYWGTAAEFVQQLRQKWEAFQHGP